MDQFGGGNWNMIPTHSSNPTTPSNNDHLYLQQQQQQFQQQQQQFQQPQQPQQQQQQYQQQQPQQFQQQQQFQLQQQQQQRYQMSQQQQPQQQQQQPQQQSFASHFHLLTSVENLGEAIENGTRDQHFDALVTDLSSKFEKCQQLLNNISASIASKAATVEGSKLKVGESEQMLSQRRELVAKYRHSLEELTKSDI